VQTVAEALLERGAHVEIVLAASAVLDQYGPVAESFSPELRACVIAELLTVIAGRTHVGSVRETALLAQDLATIIYDRRPDWVVTVADRHETVGTSIAAAYLNIPLCHIQGGEQSGSIDDKVRGANTALADLHCVATEKAAKRLTGIRRVVLTGCPSIDLADRVVQADRRIEAWPGGVGTIDLLAPFAVVLYHPDTREEEYGHMRAILEATTGMLSQVLVFWPGEDAGGEAIAKEIRTFPFAERHQIVRHIPALGFYQVLRQASVLVGNSSVGIRECAFLGVPVVNVGLRQGRRERAANVIDVPHDAAAIAAAIQRQIVDGHYLSSPLYGTPGAGRRVAEALCFGA
jgi:UDP-hydrolysing UDP-N-acetyl-D-glucosamine 2-epimerase